MVRSGLVAFGRGILQLSNGFALLCVILATWTACLVTLHRPHVGDFMDDGEYFVAAQSLRDGHGYRLPSRPGSPPQLKYPAGLSLLVAAFLPAKGATLVSDFRAARVVSAVAGLVFALTSFATLRALRVHGIVAACCIVPALWSDPVLNESLTLLSDVPFAACCTSVALIWALLRRGVIRLTWMVALGLGIVAGASLALRSNGIALCIACLAFAWEAPKRARFIALYMFGTALLPLIAKCAARAVADASPAEPYSVNWVALSSVKAAVSIVVHNAVEYAKVVPVLFFPELNTNIVSRHPVLMIAIRVAVWAVTLRWVWISRRNIRSIDSAPILFVLLTVAICLIWPWFLFLRPLVPFMPFLAAAFFLSMRWPSNRRFSIAELALATALLLVAAQFIMTVRGLRHPSYAMDQAFEYIRRGTEADAVIVTPFPETTYLYTGRQAVKLLNDSDSILRHFGDWASINAWTRVARRRPFYMLATVSTLDSADDLARQFAALAAAAPVQLREVYRSPLGSWAVFRVRDRS